MSLVRRNKLDVDLNFKKIRAISLFQSLYKQRRQNITFLNKKMGTIYSTLVSVMNNIDDHYRNDVIDQKEYNDQMMKLDSVLANYEKLPNPITLSMYQESNYENMNVTVNWLEYQAIKLVEKCGANSCYDILKIIVGPNWSIGIRHSYNKLMKFYNTVFVPRSVKITDLAEGSDPPSLPDVKKYSSYTESVLIKMHTTNPKPLL